MAIVPFERQLSLEDVAAEVIAALCKMGPKQGSALVQLDEISGDDVVTVGQQVARIDSARNNAICISGGSSLVQEASRHVRLQLDSFAFQPDAPMESLDVQLALIDSLALAPKEGLFQALLPMLGQAGWTVRLLTPVAFSTFYGSPPDGPPESPSPLAARKRQGLAARFPHRARKKGGRR
jgi:hypothetical protein